MFFQLQFSQLISGLFLLVISSVAYRLFRHYSSGLTSIPGPFLARFSRFWLLRETYHGRFHLRDIELHQKHGPIIRIAPGQYSIDDPNSVQTIYGSRGGFIKSKWYQASAPPGQMHESIFVDPDTERHAANRRKISSAYSMTNLVQLEPFINDCTDILKTKFDAFVETGEVIDLPKWLQCYAFDVIGNITLGKRFGFLDDGEDVHGIIHSLDMILLYASRIGIVPELHPVLFFANMLMFPSMKGMMCVIKFVNKIVGERLKEPLAEKRTTGPADFINRFRHLQNENPEKVRDKDIMASALANIGAGSDTTGIALTSVFYYLTRHPEVVDKVLKELDEARSRGEISTPITFGEAQHLKYLQAVLKEALRCHPATGLILGRIVPKGGCTVAGQFFPGGTTIGVNAWVAHANKDVYGDDANAFRPERWLEAPELVKRRDAYFMTFGTGTRTCLGKNISLLEISKMVPEIIQAYDIEPAFPGRQIETRNEWFVKQTNFPCRIRRRTSQIKP